MLKRPWSLDSGQNELFMKRLTSYFERVTKEFYKKCFTNNTVYWFHWAVQPVYNELVTHSTKRKARNWKKKPSPEIIIDYFRLRRNYTTCWWNYINQFLMARPSVRYLSAGSNEGVGWAFCKLYRWWMDGGFCILNAMFVSLQFTLVCCQFVINAAMRDSYSYHKFSGPVSGQIQEVYVPTASGNKGKQVDFVVSSIFHFKNNELSHNYYFNAAILVCAHFHF